MKSNLQPFLEKMIFVNNRCLLKLMVFLDLRDFFSCKRYGHLMGWSTLVDLAITSWIWVMMSWIWAIMSWIKTREYIEEYEDKSQDKNIEVMW
jgi:hypothetical protein